MEKDLIFESFRRCITEPKCVGCRWETCGKIINGHPLRIPEVRIPVDLALAVVSLMADELYTKEKRFTPAEVDIALVIHGQHDLRFKLGETIRYSPSEVRHILEGTEDKP